MRVVVDADSCTGCGLCASLCPDAFDMTEEGKAAARHKAVPAWMEDEYAIAAECCPESAIRIFSQA